MARILLAWELGAGAGHLVPLAEAGRELAAAGHECAYALRDLGNAHAFFDPAATRLYQAPLFLPGWRNDNALAFTFADILANIGYRDPAPLTGLLAAWRRLYVEFRPDLLVFDHAPTARAAARGLGIPSVLLARSGFTLPPATHPLPVLRKLTIEETHAAEQRETQLVTVLNDALGALGLPRVQYAGELFQADARILLSVPELDPYGPRDNVEYWGPLQHDRGQRAQWPDAGKAPKIFAYLRPFPTLEHLLGALEETGCASLVHVTGMSAEQCAQRSRGLTRFVPELLDVKQMLQESDLIIAHGGSLASLALLAGKPMLALPLHLEQQLTAARLETLGAGLSAPRLAPDGMRIKLLRLLREPSFAQSARNFAARYPQYPAALDGRFAALADRLLRHA